MLFPNGSKYHSVTLKLVALVTVPPRVVMTIFLPVVAPAGTVAVTVVSSTTVKLALTPPILALIVWVRLTPVMVTTVPTEPLAGLKLVSSGATRKQYNNAVPPDQVTDQFHLQAGSPAIGTGIDPTTIPGISSEIFSGLKQYVYTDIEGYPRTPGSAFDLGAYVYSGNNAPNPPTGLTATAN
jgi:hypothetical protein